MFPGLTELHLIGCLIELPPWPKCLPIKFLRNKTGKFLPETIAVPGIKPVTGKIYLILKMGSLNNKSGNQIGIILDTKKKQAKVSNEINQTIHSTN